MRVGITGANGLVGCHLINSLIHENYELSLLLRENKENFSNNLKLDIYIYNLADPQVNLSDFLNNLDIIIHCAAEIKDENKMEPLHIYGTKNLVKQCIKYKSIKHFIYLSSVGVYGFPNKGDIDENSPLKFTNEYERTKLKGEKIIQKYFIGKNRSYTILRPGPIIYHKMSNNYLISLINYVDKGKFFFIGRQKTVFNFIDISNVVDAIKHIIIKDEAKNEVFNLCDQICLNKLIEKIKKLLRNEKKTYYLPYYIAKTLSYLEILYPKFPLTSSRVRVLTSQSSFKDEKIKKRLDFKKNKKINETLDGFISEYKKLDF